jgi:hypothetical protein
MPFRSPLATAVATSAGLVALVLGWGEWEHWRASGRFLGDGLGDVPGGVSSGVPSGLPEDRATEAVVVLGFRNRGSRANYINRYRVRAALRSIDPSAAQSMLVFCGGSVASPVAEAELMSRYARDALGYTGPQRLDRDSRSTWQNIENAVYLVEGFGVIKIVSNPVHAQKARGYLWRQRPDLAARLVRARDYRFGELMLVKPFAAAVGLWKLRVRGS